MNSPDHFLWKSLSHDSQADEFYRSWLGLQCRQFRDCMRGVLVLGEPDVGPFSPAATWPEGQGGSGPLAQLAEQALVQRKGLAQRYELQGSEAESTARHGIAYPIQIDQHLYGVVAVEVPPVSEQVLQSMMHQLQWGLAWLETRFRSESARTDEALRERLVSAIELLASSLEHKEFGQAAKSFVTELATQLSCDRVSFGFLKNGHTRLVAISHSAQFGKQMNLVRLIEATMDEAIDQQTVLVRPAETSSDGWVMRSHDELASEHGAGAILTIPLFRSGEVYGALCLERSLDRPFDQNTIELCRSVVSVVGVVLEEKWANDHWLLVKSIYALRTQLEKLIGPEHFLRKIIVTGVLLLIGFFSFANGDYTIKADTVLEGAIQRVIVAPYDGYISEAAKRAGDVVKEGELLSSLDDRDMRLERLKWSSQRSQLRKQFDEFMALRDRAQINIVNAQIAQADAQLALLNEQISRTRITAPFAGVIISGDLTQSLGASVRRGDVLFEIAPLDAYRIILQVDERDIADAMVGQSGELALSAFPHEVFDFTVSRITPISTVADGRNFFRVEATLSNDPAYLRPGMEGAGKIHVNRQKLIWIWTHGLTDWLRLWVWRWT